MLNPYPDHLTATDKSKRIICNTIESCKQKNILCFENAKQNYSVYLALSNCLHISLQASSLRVRYRLVASLAELITVPVTTLQIITFFQFISSDG